MGEIFFSLYFCREKCNIAKKVASNGVETSKQKITIKKH